MFSSGFFKWPGRFGSYNPRSKHWKNNFFGSKPRVSSNRLWFHQWSFTS